MDPITGVLADMFSDVVEYALESYDATGAVIGYAASGQIAARIEEESKNVRMSDGQIISSTIQIYLDGAPGLTTKYRLTLPTRYEIRHPQIQAVRHHTDENGPHHEVLVI